jgi:hypothetical protein
MITPNNIIGARIYEKHYTIQSLTLLMRILLKILTNLNLMDIQTQLPEISIIRNISWNTMRIDKEKATENSFYDSYVILFIWIWVLAV